MSIQGKQLQCADKLCWTCETKVQAERKRTPWNAGDLVGIVVSLGLWVPLRMMYHAVANPWRCGICGTRIEPWHKALGMAAAKGFGALSTVWILAPGIVAVVSQLPTESGAVKPTASSAQAIAREKERRAAATAKFRADREQIVAEVRSLISSKRFTEAAAQAKPYLFLKDDEISGLHAQSQRRATEANLLAAAERTPKSDLNGKASVFAKLAGLDPNNPSYRQKSAYYKSQAEARAKKLAAEKRAAAKKAAAKKAKQDAIVAKYGKAPVASSWDGTYREVSTYLQRVANDPDSIEVDGCTGVYRVDDGWLVGCDYRGRNAFGGMIRKSNWFTIKHSRVIAIHESSAYRP